MANQFTARCGIDCETCEYRVQMSCSGCRAAEGKLFWGECDVAKCCVGKSLEHCGQCQEFPCKTLNDYAYDAEHGDNGKRISTLREWNEEGYGS